MKLPDSSQFPLASLVIVLLTGCATTPSDKLKSQIYPYRTDSAISISGISVYSPNSAGGVLLLVNWVNPTNRTLKYVRMTFSPQNRVGDTVASDIGRKVLSSIEAVGPFGYGDGSDRYGDKYGPLWYNHSITCVTLEKVEIVSMDNTTTVFSGKEVSGLLVNATSIKCLPSR